MSSLTFGQLVAKQQELIEDPSPDVVKASEYEIPFGKHQGMNLAMLMEQQHSYCMWLINQEESKNKNFNQTCEFIKLLIAADQADIEEGMNAKISDGNMMPPVVKVDGVELVEGEKAVLFIDPAKDDAEVNGVYEVTTDKKLGVGFISGLVSDLLKQVNENDLTFDFNSTDVNIWLKLVKELQDNEVDVFLMIETRDIKIHPQRIKRVF